MGLTEVKALKKGWPFMKRVPPAGPEEASCHVVRGPMRELQGPQSSNHQELGRGPPAPERTIVRPPPR